MKLREKDIAGDIRLAWFDATFKQQVHAARFGESRVKLIIEIMSCERVIPNRIHLSDSIENDLFDILMTAGKLRFGRARVKRVDLYSVFSDFWIERHV